MVSQPTGTPPIADRYHRQAILPGFGPVAQARLAQCHVMIVGMGALGCPAADLLARAGVGRLTLIDRDLVELTNLQRQTLYGERDIGTPKAEAAAARLRAVNSAVRIDAAVEDFSPANAEAMLAAPPRPTVLLDCTDNFQTRYLLNDAAVKQGVPLVYGGAVGTQGVQFTIQPGRSACLRCVFPDAPPAGSVPTCDSAGILAPVSAIIGATQAADALKLVIDPSTLSGSLLRFDLWSNQRTRLDLRQARDPDCTCCARARFEYLSMAIEPTILCGRNAVQVPGAGPLDLPAAVRRLSTIGRFEMAGPRTLSGTLNDGTPLTLFADGRAIVGKTTDPGAARSVLARVLG